MNLVGVTVKRQCNCAGIGHSGVNRAPRQCDVYVMMTVMRPSMLALHHIRLLTNNINQLRFNQLLAVVFKEQPLSPPMR